MVEVNNYGNGGHSLASKDIHTQLTTHTTWYALVVQSLVHPKKGTRHTQLTHTLHTPSMLLGVSVQIRLF